MRERCSRDARVRQLYVAKSVRRDAARIEAAVIVIVVAVPVTMVTRGMVTMTMPTSIAVMIAMMREAHVMLMMLMMLVMLPIARFTLAIHVVVPAARKSW